MRRADIGVCKLSSYITVGDIIRRRFWLYIYIKHVTAIIVNNENDNSC